jgi:O-antigen/teichoic acid export membrane protein
VTSTTRRDESVAAHGARWITVAFVIVGLLNYGYALLLTRLLDVAAYSRFAAGQGLILWASTVAVVCVPWVLAQALARAGSDLERNSAVRFAKLVSAASGITAAAVVGVIASRFGGPSTALVLALSTVVIFLGTTSTGWLQGRERMRTLSALYVAENILKNGAGVLLVTVARLGDTGALAAFGIGGIVMLLWWPSTPREAGRLWFANMANWYLWRRALRIAGAQGLVSLFVAIDVVLVALLPGGRALAASYQVSATLSRVPLFVASAVATAFFPSLSRRATGAILAARAMRMYAAVALPLAAILMTIPASILGVVFPAQYGAVATLLKFTAVTGLGAGGISLITAFFQAADDYTCLTWLGIGLSGYVGALLAGWRIDGIAGLAAGGAVGTAFALVILGYCLVRSQGCGTLARIPFGEPVVAVGALVALRPHLLLWLAGATLLGLRSAVRFLRPGARHARGPRWAASADRRIREREDPSVPAGTVRREGAHEATGAELRFSIALATSRRRASDRGRRRRVPASRTPRRPVGTRVRDAAPGEKRARTSLPQVRQPGSVDQETASRGTSAVHRRRVVNR